MNARLLSRGVRKALQALKAGAGDDAALISFRYGRGASEQIVETKCLIFNEDATRENRTAGSLSGGVARRWQCVFLDNSVLPRAESLFSYEGLSFRLLLVVPYFGEMYIGELEATT